jgi:hypothetical protein
MGMNYIDIEFFHKPKKHLFEALLSCLREDSNPSRLRRDDRHSFIISIGYTPAI